MAQGRSTEIVSMIRWIGTSRLSTKNSFCLRGGGRGRCERHACASLTGERVASLTSEGVTVSVGIPLCPYGTTYRRDYALSTSLPTAEGHLQRFSGLCDLKAKALI